MYVLMLITRASCDKPLNRETGGASSEVHNFLDRAVGGLKFLHCREGQPKDRKCWLKVQVIGLSLSKP